MIDRKRWQMIWQRLAAQLVPEAVFEELVRAYSSAERFYHNVRHLEDCLSTFDQTKYLAVHPAEVELAIWFHDAVYDTRRNDNEERSAEWAEAVIIQTGVGEDVAKRTSDLILATRHTMAISDSDAQLMVDVDLSILGRETALYWQYEINIRKEYAWVPEHLFREKRMEILKGFLDRQFIYYHKPYREMFEEQARTNLERAITRLSKSAYQRWLFF